MTGTDSSHLDDQRQSWMREAIRLSQESVADGGGPFGAVIVRNGAIIGRGRNRVTSANDPTAHAEIEAIRQACAAIGSFTLAGCEIYTSCEPCPMCLGAILWARLDRVWYANSREDAAAIGFDDRLFYDELLKPIESRQPQMQQMLRDEAAEAFTAWEQSDGRTTY